MKFEKNFSYIDGVDMYPLQSVSILLNFTVETDGPNLRHFLTVNNLVKFGNFKNASGYLKMISVSTHQ